MDRTAVLLETAKTQVAAAAVGNLGLRAVTMRHGNADGFANLVLPVIICSIVFWTHTPTRLFIAALKNIMGPLMLEKCFSIYDSTQLKLRFPYLLFM